jgi:hypothetical protein
MEWYNTVVGIGVAFAIKTTMRIKIFGARADANAGLAWRTAASRA